MPELNPPLEVEIAEGLLEEDRRGAERHDCSEATPCTIPLTGQRFWARVRNVSQTGVGLVTNRPFPAKTRLLVVLPASAALAPHKLRVNVIHCSRYTDGNWLLGCRFAAPLGGEELETLFRQWR
jgi:hypothetical protein